MPPLPLDGQLSDAACDSSSTRGRIAKASEDFHSTEHSSHPFGYRDKNTIDCSMDDIYSNR